MQNDADYEGELVIVIGSQPVYRVTEEEVRADKEGKIIQGITVALDITARSFQGPRGGNQWVFAKSYDTFCPISTDVASVANRSIAEVVPEMRITTRLNDNVMQDCMFKDFIFPVEKIVSVLSSASTLEPGTIILTGTPAGVGKGQKPKPIWLQHGDKLQVDIHDVTTLGCGVQYIQ